MRSDVRPLALAVTLLLSAASLAATPPTASAQEPPKNFVRLANPSPVGEIAFNDADGHARSLTDFRGKVVLLNIWATWCVPCRAEMPALDRLQGNLGSSTFEVVTVSIDRGGVNAVRKFYGEIGVQHLATYLDPSGQVLRQVRAVGLPTTLLIDAEGRGLGRVVGPAEWDQPGVADFLKAVVLAKGVPSEQADRPAAQQPRDTSESPSLVTRGLHWLGSMLDK